MSDVNLGSVKAKLEIDASGVESGVDKATKALGAFGAGAESAATSIDGLKGAYTQYSAAIAETTTALGIAGAAVGAVAAAFAVVTKEIVEAAIETAAYVEHLDKMALATGLSVDMLQSLGKAASEAGVNSDALARAVGRLEIAVANDSKAFDGLGLSLNQLKASSPDEMLKTVGERLISMTDVTERNAAATKLFGRAYAEVLPALEAYLNAGDRYVNLSESQQEASRQLDRALDEAATAWKELWQQIGAAAAAPEVAATIRDIGSAIRDMARFIQDNREVIGWFFGAVFKGPGTMVGESIREKFITGQRPPTEMGISYAELNRLNAPAVAPTAGIDLGPETEAQKSVVAAYKKQQKEKEDVAKKTATALQSEMDRLSGATAQKEVNQIATSFKNLQATGKAAGVDMAALGNRLVDLANKGAKIPSSMLPAIQAFAKQVSQQDAAKAAAKNWDESTKQAEKNLKKQSDLFIKYGQEWTKIKPGSLGGESPEALRKLEASFKAIAAQQKALGTAEGLKNADIAAHNLTATMEEMHRQGLLTADDISRIEMNETKAAASAEKWAGVLSGIIGIAGMIGGSFGEVAQVVGNIGDSFARIKAMPSGDKALADFQQANPDITAETQNALGTGMTGAQLFAKTKQNAKNAKTMGYIGAAAQAANAIGGALQKGGKADNKMVAGMALQGAAQGAQIGMIAGPYGAAIGAVIGGAIGFMKGHKIKKQATDAGKALGTEVGVELAKSIAATAKSQKISMQSAALLHLTEAMESSKKKASEFAPQVSKLMEGIAKGSIPAKEGLEQIGQAFTKIADEAMKSGKVGSREMVKLIKQSREMKIDSPEIKAFVGAQLDSALQGISKYVAAINTLGKAAEKGGEAQVRFAEIGKTSGVVFGAMFQALAAEKGITTAVDAMKADYYSLHETLSQTLGADAVAAILGPVGGAFATLADETLRPMFEGIDGITQAMTGLANAGYLSTDQFVAMQDATAQLFDEAVAGGADMRTALQAVAPGIQAAISAAEQFGVPLDADMARLKALAEQNGITFATDPQAAMLDVLVSIAQVLGAEVPASAQRAKAAMMDMANSVPNDLSFDVNVNRNISDNYYGGGGGGGGAAAPEGGGGAPAFAPFMPGGGEEPFEGFQHGSGGIRDFGAGTPVVLHGREAVVTEKQAQTMGGATATFNATFNVDPLQSNAARDDLAQFVIDEFIRQARSSPMIRQLLRQDGGR